MLDITVQTPLGINLTAVPPSAAERVRKAAPNALITAADFGGIVIPDTPKPNAAQNPSEETAMISSRSFNISVKLNIAIIHSPNPLIYSIL